MKEKINNLVLEYLKQKLSAQKWTAKKDWVQYSGPYFTEDEYANVIDCLLGGWLVLGDKSLQFEKAIAKTLGKKYGIVTNSGSSANLLMLSTAKEFYGLKNKDEIITPVAGFPTTVNPILQTNLTPVFIDIDLTTLNLDTSSIFKFITNKTKALLFAHALGNPPNLNTVMDIVKKNSLFLFEDCCDSLGSLFNGQPLGSFGSMSTSSFYPAHHITLGEGGLLACNSAKEEKIARSFRDWGRGCYCVGKNASMSACGTCGKRFSSWLPQFPNSVFDHKYLYERIGYNLKPIELQCAIGLAQIKKLPEIHHLRKRNYNLLYNIFLKYEEFFILPKATLNSDPSWFAFPLTIKNNSIFKRSDLVSFLEKNKIQTRNYFGGNLLLQPAYKGLYQGNAIKDFPNATKSMFDTFFLGTSPIITKEQIDYISEITAKFFKTL